MTDTERLPPFVNATERQLRKERAEELAEAFERHLMTAEMKHQRECDGRPSTEDAGHHDPLLAALIREHPEMAVKFWRGNEP